MAPTLHLSTTILLFVLAFSFLVPCAADIGKETVDIDYRSEFTIIWQFQYAVGGSLAMDMSVASSAATERVNNSLQLMLCTDAQIEPLRNAQLSDVCQTEVFDYVKCIWQSNFGNPYNLTASLRMEAAPSRDWYRLLQLNCHHDSYKVTFAYTAMNPGGEYLSLSDIPYKTMYPVVLVVWGLLTIVWLVNWVRYRAFNVKLQRIFTLVPFTQAVVSFVFFLVWNQESRTGIQSTTLRWISLVLYCISRGCFFLALMLTAKGWAITRQSLGGPDIRGMVVLIFLLVVAHGLYSELRGFVLFFLVVMYIIVLRTIFASVVNNVQLMANQLSVIRSLNLDVTATPLWTKLVMYKRFQIVMLLYLSVDVIFHLWASIFLRATPWVEDLVEIGINLTVCLVVGTTFAMRPFTPAYFVVLGDGTETGEGSQFAPLPGDDGEGGGGRDEEEEEEDDEEQGNASGAIHLRTPPNAIVWKPGMPYPRNRITQLSTQPGPVILVEHPHKPNGVGVVVARPERPVSDSSIIQAPITPSLLIHRSTTTSSSASSSASAASSYAAIPMAVTVGTPRGASDGDGDGDGAPWQALPASARNDDE